MRDAASAKRNPIIAPSIAEYNDSFSEKINDERFDAFIASTIADVVDPVTGRKALVNNTTVGTRRNSPTKVKYGSIGNTNDGDQRPDVEEARLPTGPPITFSL
jgi:hypothetical protein